MVWVSASEKVLLSYKRSGESGRTWFSGGIVPDASFPLGGWWSGRRLVSEYRGRDNDPTLPSRAEGALRSRSMLRSGRFWFALVFAAVLLLPGLYLSGRTVYRLLAYQRAEGVARFDARGRRGIS